jgi:hypothetical protein
MRRYVEVGTVLPEHHCHRGDVLETMVEDHCAEVDGACEIGQAGGAGGWVVQKMSESQLVRLLLCGGILN